MSRRRRRKFSRDPFEAGVEDLSHDGRGVATHEEKKVFIHGALPGERVMARLTDRKRHFDEGEALEILESSPDRIEPECPHFGQCGGCSLQHLHPERQIEYKDRTLRQNLARIGKVEPESWWAPLAGPLWAYRRQEFWLGAFTAVAVLVLGIFPNNEAGDFLSWLRALDWSRESIALLVSG